MDYHEDEFPNAAMERIGGYTVLTASINTAGSLPLTVKRLTDIAAGLVGCVIMGIAFLFVAPAIYKASPGPIFFKQERMGKNGRRFWMYKFRSMYLDAEEREKRADGAEQDGRADVQDGQRSTDHRQREGTRKRDRQPDPPAQH